MQKNSESVKLLQISLANLKLHERWHAEKFQQIFYCQNVFLMCFYNGKIFVVVFTATHSVTLTVLIVRTLEHG